MILIDQNLSHKLGKLFMNKKVVARHVYAEDLHGADDVEIWQYAKNLGYTILTKDTDFEVLQSIWGFPPKIIILKCGNASTRIIMDLLDASWLQIIDFLSKDTLGIIEVS
ncbi:DUF5615 family PIN-like protein [Gramella sp. AN32]|uniref:DUF5615 family PIN-like protein n=1 Tax=Christiangramia antarctica TaxID=2058158 RepID=A0ABW5X937_9FLAO|nr:DUF5615 family PIN-like protein [Gramella sp. AN32]MCM4154760.1 hypothetical protein [Gramella sp. AN32]